MATKVVRDGRWARDVNKRAAGPLTRLNGCLPTTLHLRAACQLSFGVACEGSFVIRPVPRPRLNLPPLNVPCQKVQSQPTPQAIAIHPLLIALLHDRACPKHCDPCRQNASAQQKAQDCCRRRSLLRPCRARRVPHRISQAQARATETCRGRECQEGTGGEATVPC